MQATTNLLVAMDLASSADTELFLPFFKLFFVAVSSYSSAILRSIYYLSASI